MRAHHLVLTVSEQVFMNRYWHFAEQMRKNAIPSKLQNSNFTEVQRPVFAFAVKLRGTSKLGITLHYSPTQAQHSTARHSTAQHSTAQHTPAQPSTVQRRTSTGQHSSAANELTITAGLVSSLLKSLVILSHSPSNV